jgi:hypothetical protein
LLFGSQIFGNGSSANDNALLFSKDEMPDSFLLHMAKTYALDIFSSNYDRHINNYLVREQNGKERMLSFDFGWSLFRDWPNALLPMRNDCNTILNKIAIDSKWGLSKSEIISTLDSISALPDNYGASLMSGIPEGWLRKNVASEFSEWWSGVGRANRVAMLKSEVANGNL